MDDSAEYLASASYGAASRYDMHNGSDRSPPPGR